MMYDHDVITKNDFLGSVTFTLDDLKKIASNVQVKAEMKQKHVFYVFHVYQAAKAN